MRLFVAIKFSKEMKDILISAQNRLRSEGIKGNYTNCDNLHLTLAFIGEYNDPKGVAQVLNQISFKPFSIRFSGRLGAFGELWWAGLEKQPALGALASEIRRALSDNSIPYDKKAFRPHITLLRRAEAPFGSDFELDSMRISSSPMLVKEFFLMRSSRENGRLVYTELDTFTSG